jgi:hypothetical protein
MGKAGSASNLWLTVPAPEAATMSSLLVSG